MMESLKAKLEQLVLDKIPVSRDFVVLYVIYKLMQANERVWLAKVVNALGGKMTKSEVMQSIDNLNMWGIIHGEYGDSGEGHACMLYAIDDCHYGRVAGIVARIDDLIGK